MADCNKSKFVQRVFAKKREPQRDLKKELPNAIESIALFFCGTVKIVSTKNGGHRKIFTLLQLAILFATVSRPSLVPPSQSLSEVCSL